MKNQGGFPVSLASDAAGNIWVGTEGNGLWKYDARKKGWTQFTTKDGLGDDCVYALAVDGSNRVWAGHLNHGVSVYNGDKWRNYGLIEGPLGDRVFAIAISPKDGDVWMATDMGLARYSEKRVDWDYYTRASGLPSDQIQSITFGASGDIYAGTQCAGIAIATADDNYSKWHTMTASNSPATLLIGDGLASDLVNSIAAVAADGMDIIAALSPSGVSATVDEITWKHLVSAPGGVAAGGMSVPLFPESWMTALEFAGNRAWLGYRKFGVELRAIDQAGSVEVQANVTEPETVFIRAILALPDQPPLIAAYDAAAGGLLTLDNAPAVQPVGSGTNTKTPISNLPAPVSPPVIEDATALRSRLGKLTQQLNPGEAYFLADDWRTQGDWVGRYGNAYVKLCAMADNLPGTAQSRDQDYSLLPGYEVSVQLGPHFKKNINETGDNQRRPPIGSHSDEKSDDPRSLYNPTLGHRRDAMDSDGSDKTDIYPESFEGPGLWVSVKVPDGVHCLSFYFLNHDGHTAGGGKYRDYDVQVFPGQEHDGTSQTGVDFGPPLVRTRVTDFWGGVYKQFLVCGPARYLVSIGRNRSFGTNLQAVFLDRVTPTADIPGVLPGFDAAPYEPPDEPANYHPTPLADAALNLWSQLDDALALRGAIPLQMPLRIWCYRAACAGGAPAEILDRWRWEIGIWTQDDRKIFDAAMKAAFDAAK